MCKIIQTAIGPAKITKEGIVKIEVDFKNEISESILKKYNEELKTLKGDKNYCCLYVFNDFADSSSDTLKFISTEENFKNKIADAYVFNSIASKIVGNFHLKINKPPKPTKIFNTETQAIEWLKSFI